MIFLRQPRRVWQLIVIYAQFYLGPRLGLGPYAGRPGAIRLRLALERLGGAWVKLGQMLAMRPDLVPAEYCDSLLKLLNQVEPFPYADVRRIVSEELGDVPERLFRRFETASFAAASIGQVHRATLHSGEDVAVKVQRPGVRAAIAADIDLMYAASGLLDRVRLFGATPTRSVIEEFARWTADELDYVVEARQASMLYENAKGERLEKVARVHREFSTSRVLTTELIVGIPLVDVIQAVREHDTAYLDDLAARGHDRDRIVMHLDWNMLNQVFVFGYFHADLHPANLYVLPGDVIGYVDFGIVGRLSQRLRDSLARYGWLLFRGEIEPAVEEFMRWVKPTSGSDEAAARRQLVRVHEVFVADTAESARASRPDLAPREPDDNPYLGLAVGLMRAIRDNELTVAASVVAYMRMLVTIGTLRHQLALDYDVASTARRFFRRLMRHQVVAWFDPRTTIERVHAGRAQVQRALDLVDFLESQEQVITLATTSLFGVRRRVRAARKRLVRLGVATLVSAAALYIVLVDPDGMRSMLPSGVPYTWVHGGLLIILVLLLVTLVVHLRRFGSPD